MNNTLKVIAFLYVYFFVDAAHAAEPAPANTDTAAGWIKLGSSPVLGTCFDIAVLREGDAYRMWYSGGEQYEPNAIGYATSSNGREWTKFAGNPIF